MISMKHSAAWFNRMALVHRELSSGTGTILVTPTARPATSEEASEAATLITSGDANAWPLVETFPGGTLTRIELDNTTVIQLASDSPDDNHTPGHSHITTITCTDSMDADSIYAHAATTLGLLTETCAGCEKPIPAVYEICAECA